MRVLIALEDEPFLSAIVDFVSSHSWQPGTIFKLLHAAEPTYVGDQVTAIYGNDLQNKILEDRVEQGRALVAKAKEQLQNKLSGSVPIETNVTIGRPHHVILQTAEEWDAEMIIMGSHGRTGFDKFLLGSVSLAVLSHAKCSVAIVRLPKSAEVHKESGRHTHKKATNKPQIPVRSP